MFLRYLRPSAATRFPQVVISKLDQLNQALLSRTFTGGTPVPPRPLRPTSDFPARKPRTNHSTSSPFTIYYLRFTADTFPTTRKPPGKNAGCYPHSISNGFHPAIPADAKEPASVAVPTSFQGYCSMERGNHSRPLTTLSAS